MHPVLLSFGSLVISSFGFFLALGFLAGLFTVWRLSRIYDIDEEKILDVSLLTFFGGLLGARILFAVFNPGTLNSVERIFSITRYPGLMLYGGLILGAGILYLLSKKLRLDFFQMADFLLVGVFAAEVLGSFGCLLGSCHPGITWSGPLSVDQAGLLGSRFPTQLLETVIFAFLFLIVWKEAVKFHFSGKILSLGLILLGLENFAVSFLRSDSILLFDIFNLTRLLGFVSFILGLVVIYTQGRRDIFFDLGIVADMLTNSKRRKTVLLSFKKGWYTTRVNLKSQTQRAYRSSFTQGKSLLKNINVRPRGPKI